MFCSSSCTVSWVHVMIVVDEWTDEDRPGGASLGTESGCSGQGRAGFGDSKAGSVGTGYECMRQRVWVWALGEMQRICKRMCLLLTQQYLVFVQIAADYLPPTNTSICVVPAKPPSPFVCKQPAGQFGGARPQRSQRLCPALASKLFSLGRSWRNWAL